TMQFRTTNYAVPEYGSGEVFDEDDFVLFLVVDQFVGGGANRQHAEAAGAQALGVANGHVVQRVIVMNRGVIEMGEGKARPRIRNAIHQHAVGAHAGDPDLVGG